LAASDWSKTFLRVFNGFPVGFFSGKNGTVDFSESLKNARLPTKFAMYNAEKSLGVI
jgi:hypothetical protein